MAKTTLKKNNFGGQILPDFKSYFKAIVIKTIQDYTKIDEEINKTEFKNGLKPIWITDFRQRYNGNSGEKDSLFNKQSGTTIKPCALQKELQSISHTIYKI